MVGMTQASTKRWTRAELDSLPEDGNRYEIVDGELFVSPAPRIRHQWTAMRLASLLLTACDALPGRPLMTLMAPTDVALADDTVIQPDIVVAPRADYTERDLPVAPLLAVEILSPSTRLLDLNVKKDRLQHAGTRHYWVVDPDEPSITTGTLTEGAYQPTGHATGHETLHISEPVAIDLTPADLIV